MKLFYSITFAAFILGCSENKTINQPTKIPSGNQLIQKQPYFNFDEVLHFNSGLNKSEIPSLIEKEEKNKKETAQYRVIFEPKLKSIKDSSFIEIVLKAGFFVDTLPLKSHQQLNHIFSKKSDKEGYSSSCIAEYNDYFVFKKDNKIIGIALICFGCNQSIFIGSPVNTLNFGIENEYKLLKDLILNENPSRKQK